MTPDKTQDPVDLEAAGHWLSHDNQDVLTVEFGKRLIAEIRALRSRPSPASPAPQGLDWIKNLPLLFEDYDSAMARYERSGAGEARAIIWEEVRRERDRIVTRILAQAPVPSPLPPPAAPKEIERVRSIIQSMTDVDEAARKIVSGAYLPSPLEGKAPAGFDALKKQIGLELTAITAQREEICRAFLAKYGCEPDALEQVIQHLPDGTVWFVRPRPEVEGKDPTRSAPAQEPNLDGSAKRVTGSEAEPSEGK